MSGIEVVTEDDVSRESAVEVEPGTGDEEYHSNDELEYDAEEEDGEAAGEEAAAAVLAGSKEPATDVEAVAAAGAAPNADDIMSVLSSAKKIAQQPEPPRLLAGRMAINQQLNFDLTSQHTPNKDQLKRIAASAADFPNLETLACRLQTMANLDWDDMTEKERRTRSCEQNVLFNSMIEGIASGRQRQTDLGRAAGKLADEADERGQSAAGLAAIAAASSSAGTGYTGPNVWDPDRDYDKPRPDDPWARTTLLFPNAAPAGPYGKDGTHQKMYDMRKSFAHSMDGVEAGPNKDAMQNVIGQLDHFMRLAVLETQKADTRRKEEASKQNHWNCQVFKNLEKFDNEKDDVTINTWLTSTVYVLKSSIKTDQWKTAILSKMSKRIFNEILHIENENLERGKKEWTYSDVIHYLSRTYKADEDRETLVTKMAALTQGDNRADHFIRRFNEIEREIAAASGGQNDSATSRLVLFKGKLDKDLRFEIARIAREDWQLQEWQDAAHTLDPACQARRKEGKKSDRALVVSNDKFQLADEVFQALGPEGRRAYLGAVRTAKAEDGNGGRNQHRSTLAAVEQVAHDTKISFGAVKHNYTEKEIEKRFEAMTAKTPPSDSDLRSLYDKDFMTVKGQKLPCCIRCKSIGEHMLWQCTKTSAPRGQKRKGGGGKGKGKGGGKGKRKLTLNAITAGAHNMSAEDKIAAIAALQQ